MFQKKYDKLSVNDSSKEFIPAACHFDTNTLITKNGELLQTIQINGINSEDVSDNLFNLRQVVRDSISGAIVNHKYAFWIHTIRRKANLDDTKEYNSFFSDNLHNIWKNKNYWDDKFVNTLYITIIHDAPELSLKNYNSLVNSLSPKVITNFEERFFDNALQEITKTADIILEGLSGFGAKKIGIRCENNNCYSDLMFLYRRIMQLNEDQCKVPTSDISSALAMHKYTVGNDMIEVVGESGKKFAAIMSIKEYQEVSSEALDRFLQIPVEMVATEVFYFVNHQEVTKRFKDQEYILGVSKADDLRKYKGLNKVFSNKNESDNKSAFCHQQISCMVIGDDLENLEKQVIQASEALSRIGIVHVREDINLEKTFWAQLPANFRFLSRMHPTIIENTCALASLHNFPTGNKYSPWGRAITLLRTEKGTPYFMNFHDKTKKGATCIFGDYESGKTTLMNFLLSESDKFAPTTLYVTNKHDSQVYINAREGTWSDDTKNIINPLLCEETKENLAYLIEFFKILSKHYFDPLSEKELVVIEDLCKKIFKIPVKDRKISVVIDKLGKSKEETSLKTRLADFTKKGKYYDIFNTEENYILNPGELFAINLSFLDEDEFIKKNLPKEKKLMEKFEYNLNSFRALKTSVAFAVSNILFNSKDESKKILAIDNLTHLIYIPHYQFLIPQIIATLDKKNCITCFAAGNDQLVKMQKEGVKHNWIKSINTSFILPSHISAEGLDTIFDLNRAEMKKLVTLTVASRMFLIKQDDHVITSEFSTGGMKPIIKMLCSNENERKLANKLMTQYVGKNISDWVEGLYTKFDELE